MNGGDEEKREREQKNLNTKYNNQLDIIYDEIFDCHPRHERENDFARQTHKVEAEADDISENISKNSCWKKMRTSSLLGRRPEREIFNGHNCSVFNL